MLYSSNNYLMQRKLCLLQTRKHEETYIFTNDTGEVQLYLSNKMLLYVSLAYTFSVYTINKFMWMVEVFVFFHLKLFDKTTIFIWSYSNTMVAVIAEVINRLFSRVLVEVFVLFH